MAHMPLQMDDHTMDRLGPLMEACLEIDKAARKDWIENLQDDHQDLAPYLRMIFQRSYSLADGSRLPGTRTDAPMRTREQEGPWFASLLWRHKGAIAVGLCAAVLLTMTVGIGVTVIAALAALNGIGGYVYYHYGRIKSNS